MVLKEDVDLFSLMDWVGQLSRNRAAVPIDMLEGQYRAGYHDLVFKIMSEAEKAWTFNTVGWMDDHIPGKERDRLMENCRKKLKELAPCKKDLLEALLYECSFNKALEILDYVHGQMLPVYAEYFYALVQFSEDGVAYQPLTGCIWLESEEDPDRGVWVRWGKDGSSVEMPSLDFPYRPVAAGA